MCGSMVDIQSATAENKRGEKEEERRNHRTKIEWPALFGGHKNRRQRLLLHNVHGLNMHDHISTKLANFPRVCANIRIYPSLYCELDYVTWMRRQNYT